jgi:arylsulfatase A-like enzyme
MIKLNLKFISFLLILLFSACNTENKKPNVIIIYADDLGFGDVSAYNQGTLNTPNIDRIANEGIKFTNGHSSSATCSPSRYALLTGSYPWRNSKAKISTGASMIINVDQKTLPKMFKANNYSTAIVGKWHLGLGNGQINYNSKISPGPNDVGFDYSYIMPDTQDRVPTVYIEDGYVKNLDPNDPLYVSFNKNFDNQPTGKTNPEMLTMKWHHGHFNSIINGISRIGFMKGGEKAHWSDVDMADHFLNKAKSYITQNKDKPFFLFYSMQQPHVPRTPHPRFKGKSGMGPRGDVIIEADWCIGELFKTLDNEKLLENTLIIISSDNGPVLNDGYYDDAVEKIGNHTPSGIYRGGKYSLFEAGTRVPFISFWKGVTKPKTSDKLISQIDLFNSLSSIIESKIKTSDSYDLSELLLKGDGKEREELILEASGKTALKYHNWVLIPPYKGKAVSTYTNVELGRSSSFQLYNLKTDPSQKINLVDQEKEKLAELLKIYNKVVND